MEELTPWERRASQWLSRHPTVIERIGEIVNKSVDYDRSIGMFLICTLPPFLLALAAMGLALIVGDRWWLVASAFGVTALFFAVSDVFEFFCDRRRARLKNASKSTA